MADRIARGIAVTAERISSLLGLRVMRCVASVNKYVINPILRLWASHMGKMAVIEHRGRRSGKTYRTPVMAFVQSDEFMVVLNYGAGSDWVRNVQTAGSAIVLHRGSRFRLSDPRVIPIGSAGLPDPLRGVRTPGRYVLCGELIEWYLEERA